MIIVINLIMIISAMVVLFQFMFYNEPDLVRRPQYLPIMSVVLMCAIVFNIVLGVKDLLQ